ncbi:hypothetical protein [Streptomyces sp. AC512_CC834]|uniref:hypothetical protein n=1 Tax=Streptomyces sp. AC512_CC834 TaxID=2823691 RepID=UPI001C26A072|nr:hypothetical protein [Streptomyces sp. AC512_CC834]
MAAAHAPLRSSPAPPTAHPVGESAKATPLLWSPCARRTRNPSLMPIWFTCRAVLDFGSRRTAARAVTTPA